MTDPAELADAIFYLHALKRSLGGQVHRNIDTALAGLAALERVRALHVPVETEFVGGRKALTCEHCNTGDPYCTVSSDWPCPTIAALEARDD